METHFSRIRKFAMEIFKSYFSLQVFITSDSSDDDAFVKNVSIVSKSASENHSKIMNSRFENSRHYFRDDLII